MTAKEQLLEKMEPSLRQVLAEADWAGAEEIRLRVGRPIALKREEGWTELSVSVSREALQLTLERLCNYSLYAVQEQLRRGFFTLSGGFRVGVCGRVEAEGECVTALTDAGSLCIRLCRQVKGCGNHVLPYLWNGKRVYNTLLVSPPGRGKTTLLRDLVRLISNRGIPVGLVDERGEVAGAYGGVPQLDVGRHTDVLDGAPKGAGLLMLLRSMAPQLVAVDEIGGQADTAALGAMVGAGVSLLCTAHGDATESLWEKPNLAPLLRQRVFARILLLTEGRRCQIYDADGLLLGEVSLCL